MDTTATAAVDQPARVTVIGSDGVLEVLSDDVHEVGGRILLHTERGNLGALPDRSVARAPLHRDAAVG